MTKAAIIPLVAALAMAAACDADIGTNDNAQADNGSAEAREGRVSISVPGINIDVAMPDDVRVDAQSDSDLLYPGATLSGINIDGSGDGAVTIGFTTPDASDRVTSWYRDAGRTGFTIDRVTQEGGDSVLSGRDSDNNSPFTLRLSPAQGGGTEGTLSLRDGN